MEQADQGTPSETPFADALRREIEHESGEPVEDSPEAESDDAAEPQEAAEDQPEQEADAPEAQPQVAEVEIDGKVYQVPPELKDGYLRQSDYTRKTQEVARERDSVLRERATVEQTVQAMQHLWPVIGELTSTQQYLQRLQNLDWNTLQAQDPIEHNRLRLEAIEAQNRFGNLAAQIDQFSQRMQYMRTQAIAEETQRNLPKALELVPDLPKRRNEFVSVGRSYGFDETELGAITDPRMIAALRDLAEFKRLTANRDMVKQKIQNAPEIVARPGTKKAPAPNVDLKKAMHALRTDRSDDAFVAALRAQRKGR